MQTRPYEGKGGRKIWLSRTEQAQLLDVVGDDYPRRRIALQLGLHGLRTDEIMGVSPEHFEQLDVDPSQFVPGHDGDDWQPYRLVIPDGKTGRRETPASHDLQQRVSYLKGASRMRQDDPVIDVSKRSVRDWIEGAREQLAAEHDDEHWLDLTMHDLRRTFATDSYYSLAFEGVPIAEQLVMSFGGWKMTETGRETFRRDYLGPVPDHITARAMGRIGLP